MGDIARCSLGKENDYYNEDLLYRMFGVNAELLIDHAWGYEPCTIADVKAYQPENHSVGSAGFLACPPSEGKGSSCGEWRTFLALDLVDKADSGPGESCDGIRYRKPDGFQNSERTTAGRYPRTVMKTDPENTPTAPEILAGKLPPRNGSREAVMELYDEIMNPKLLVRRITISANHVVCEERNRTCRSTNS